MRNISSHKFLLKYKIMPGDGVARIVVFFKNLHQTKNKGKTTNKNAIHVAPFKS